VRQKINYTAVLLSNTSSFCDWQNRCTIVSRDRKFMLVFFRGWQNFTYMVNAVGNTLFGIACLSF
jgi:hypothetical protein